MIQDNSPSGSHVSHPWNLLGTWIEKFFQDPDRISFYICREPEPASWQGMKYLHGATCSTLGIVWLEMQGAVFSRPASFMMMYLSRKNPTICISLWSMEFVALVNDQFLFAGSYVYVCCSPIRRVHRVKTPT